MRILTTSALVAASMLAIGAISSNAGELTWTGDGDPTSFADGNNWSAFYTPGGEPDDIAIFDGANASGDVSLSEPLAFEALTHDGGSLVIDGGISLTLLQYNGTAGTLTLNSGAQVLAAAPKTVEDPDTGVITTVNPSSVIKNMNIVLNGGTTNAVTRWALPLTSYFNTDNVPDGATPGWGNGAFYEKAGSLNFTAGVTEIANLVFYAGDVTMTGATVNALALTDFKFCNGNLTMTNSHVKTNGPFKFSTDNGASSGNKAILTNSSITVQSTNNNSSLLYFFCDGATDGSLELQGDSSIKVYKNATLGYGTTTTAAPITAQIDLYGNSFIETAEELWIGRHSGPTANVIGSNVVMNLHDSAYYGGTTDAGGGLRVGVNGFRHPNTGGKYTMDDRERAIGELNLLAPGTRVKAASAEIGYNNGKGTVNLSRGSELNATGAVRVGFRGGKGLLTMDSAIMTVGNELQVGFEHQGNVTSDTDRGWVSGDGTLIANGASVITVTGNNAFVGCAGSGEYAILEGMERRDIATGYMTLNDTSKLTVKQFIVGFRTDGTGTLVMNGNSEIICLGTDVNGNGFNIGFEGGTGYVTMNDDAHIVQENGKTFTVGRHGAEQGLLNTYGGHGYLTMNDRAKIDATTMEIGRDRHCAYGEVIMKDNSVINLTNRILLASGSYSTGILTMSGNAKINITGNNDIMLGYSVAAVSSTLNMNNDAQINTPVFNFNNGSNTATLNDSATINASSVNFNGGNSTLVINEGTKVTVTGQYKVADGRKGATTQSTYVNAGGTLDVGGEILLGSYTDSSVHFIVDGGTVKGNRILIGNHFSNDWNHDKYQVVFKNGATAQIAANVVVSQRGSQPIWAYANSNSALEIGGALLVAHNDTAQTNNADGSVNGGSAPAYTTGVFFIGTDDDLDDATTVTAKDVFIGSNNANGRVELSGGAILAATENFVVGHAGAGTFNLHDAATATAPGNLYIGGAPVSNAFYTMGTNGTVTMNDTAALNVTGKIHIANTFTSEVLDNPDTLENEYKTSTVTGNGTFTLNNGTVTAQGFVKGNGTATVALNGGTVNVTGTGAIFENFAQNAVSIGENGIAINADNAVAINSGLTGTGNLTKNGTGTLTISGDNSEWTGTVKVNEGTVSIANGTHLGIVLDVTNAEDWNTVDADNTYTLTPGSTVGNAILHVTLKNAEGLVSGIDYGFTVFKGITSFGNVQCAADENVGYRFENGAIIVTVGTTTQPPVEEESGFANWATEEFDSDELADPAISGPEADPQNIGVPNLLRYALGLGRNESPVGALPTLTKNGTAGGLGALSAGDSYTFSYPCDLTKTDIEYIVETSTDLKNWIPVSTPATVDEQNGTASVVISADGAVRKFFRLKIVQK